MPDLLIGAAPVALQAGQGAAAGASANARLMLHRSAVITVKETGGLSLAHEAISAWAVTTNLSQGHQAGHHVPAASDTAHDRPGIRPARSGVDDLLAAVARRRSSAVAALSADGRTGLHTVMLEARGAVIIGTGDAGIRDVGIELHGTYGWPMLPGSSLKGVTREYARLAGLPTAEIDAIFGTEPEGDDGVPGSVTFFDALPGPDGVEVSAHVLTPHTRGYRSAVDADTGPVAPGESINPVPIPFLAVERGGFLACLTGPEPQVSTARDLLVDAVTDLGIGAKTAAGYGYLTEIARNTSTNSDPAEAGGARPGRLTTPGSTRPGPVRQKRRQR